MPDPPISIAKFLQSLISKFYPYIFILLPWQPVTSEFLVFTVALTLKNPLAIATSSISMTSPIFVASFMTLSSVLRYNGTPLIWNQKNAINI